MALAHNPNNFFGELNEKDILIHTVTVLNRQSSYDWVARIFPNIKDQRERNYIASILEDCELFDYRTSTTQKSFQISAKCRKAVFQSNAATVVDEYLNSETDHPLPFIQMNQTFNAGRDILKSGNQDSFFEESPMTQSVNTTPSKKEAATTWYTSPLFIYFVWPVIVVLIGGFILYRLGWV